ncbi:MAG: AAA family ATPase [Coriobacteriales bacterium]|jgi:DNA helicase-2/ATP-dependent DNA helicase PcrA|nr:AAA family ATPase [Coriobacteriales bacterium]
MSGTDTNEEPEVFREIASCAATAIKITGGSGTGKSLALIRRIESLLRQGATPESFHVFVSTKAAAREFSARLGESDLAGAHEIKVTTLRDFCLELLARPEVQEATGRYPRVLADFEYKILLEDIKVLGIKPKRIREMLKFFYHEWSMMDDEKDDFITDGEEELVLSTLKGLLIERKALLSEEISTITFRFLRDKRETRAAIARPHVLADDYQNLNKASQLILDTLASQSLTIAGNENEQVKLREPFPLVLGFTTFTEDHPGTKEFLLTQSLRCPQSIAAAGNALVLGSDMAQDGLVTFSRDDPRGQIGVVKWATPKEELAGIAGYLQKRILDEDDYLKAEDVFVVVPNREWGSSFVRAFQELGIKTTAILRDQAISGDPRVYERCKSLLAYTLLNLAADPTDPVAWRNWCGYGDYLTRSNLWNKLEEQARKSNSSVLDALKALSKNTESPFTGSEDLVQRYQTGLKILKAQSGKNGFALLNALTPSGEEPPAQILSLLEPINGSETAQEFFKTASQRLFEPDFLPGPALRIGLQKSLVGLSVPLVLIVGAVNGFIPSSETITTFDDTGSNRAWHSDRCLFYSVLTKAKRELVISYFQKESLGNAEPLGMDIRRIRSENGGRKAIVAQSAFLDEMGDSLPGATSSL